MSHSYPGASGTSLSGVTHLFRAGRTLLTGWLVIRRAGERTQDQQRRRCLLVDRPQCEQSQRNCARRRVHRQ